MDSDSILRRVPELVSRTQTTRKKSAHSTPDFSISRSIKRGIIKSGSEARCNRVGTIHSGISWCLSFMRCRIQLDIFNGASEMW
jgi:hypothetical protein